MRFIRRIFRFVSFLFLVIMIIVLVIDAAHSVGASTITFTSIASTASFILSLGTSTAENPVLNFFPLYLSPAVEFVSRCPTWIVFGILALVSYMIGYDGEALPDAGNFGDENV
ncbi:unnamed protein product [Bartonella choladocola]|uniref:hypothetical protein n=1 Tax=Bartonella TaxID=773 RepID=UPI0018DB6E66|nr:hypothetical protein [Bartonella choladocola]MBI0139864.1 hypothetical protein [Bartonella choladocola]